MVRILLAVLSTTLLLMSNLALAQRVVSTVNEPVNLSTYKQQLIQYHNSGAYYQQVGEVMRRAMKYLRFRVNQNQNRTHPKKLAIVMDIDETTLSNYDDMLKLNFGGKLDTILALTALGHDPAVPYTLALYRFAKAHEVAVFFITGRPDYMKEATIKNLHNVGYRDWNGLYLKPKNYHYRSIAHFKTAMRHSLVRRGYDVIANIGDQRSDLSGGYADMQFKIANPFYQIP